MAKPWREDWNNIAEETHAPPRPCDSPNCTGHGEHRAPKARDRLNDYYWFCFSCVTHYNRAWDYCAGMSMEEIESMIRASVIGDRPSWPMGNWRSYEQRIRDRVSHDFYFKGTQEQRTHNTDAKKKNFVSPEIKALAILNLSENVNFYEIRSHYLALVKKLHPDANGNDPEAEEQLKQINHAYGVLKSAYSD